MGRHHAPEVRVPEHGVRGYKRGCRCDVCREGNAEYARAWRSSGVLAADDPRHGTGNGYTNWGCRCLPCQQAWATYQKDARLARSEARTAGEQG